MLNRPPTIAIVVPCYNEEAALPASVPVLLNVLDRLGEQGLASADSYVMCVDDGSRDTTWELIGEFHRSDRRVRGITLAHNRGHQYALLAGLMAVMDHCDAAVSIDADLQDDPEAIIAMAEEFGRGKEIVYGVRSSRATDTFFKRSTAHAFYSFQNAMGLETVYDHADYRLMSNRALRLLSEYSESNMFLRGIIPMIGLDTSVVTYERAARVAGESKYPLSKMLALSVDGITSFSAKPMRWIFYVGLFSFIATVAVAVYVLVSYFCSSHTNPGWASMMLSIWGLGSMILMAIGIVGEYIGKIFTEVKSRPRYAVKDRIWD
ncbi:MAG: glycosyltransferase family 2 protein [Muribaculaceae bacterium]|nr:glycosyltransferase family 2 protein [Muribaculaceae bacterium]